MKLGIVLLFVVILALTVMVQTPRQEVVFPQTTFKGKLSDAQVRNFVVLVYGPVGNCTGSYIRAPSGRVYILSAAHCADVSPGKFINIRDEDGSESVSEIIKMDESIDLLLLDSSKLQGLKIAKTAKLHDKVHTVTHGNALPLFKTEGEIIAFSECESRLVRQESTCLQYPPWYVTTAYVLAGSSGGPLLNTYNELVGVVDAVSQAQPIFSRCIRLDAIQQFIKEF